MSPDFLNTLLFGVSTWLMNWLLLLLFFYSLLTQPIWHFQKGFHVAETYTASGNALKKALCLTLKWPRYFPPLVPKRGPWDPIIRKTTLPAEFRDEWYTLHLCTKKKDIQAKQNRNITYCFKMAAKLQIFILRFFGFSKNLKSPLSQKNFLMKIGS